MTARILVLGAGGFIGARVVRALAASDWAEPVATGRRARAATAGAPAVAALDATDAAAIGRALPGITAVVNCAVGDERTIVANARALAEAVRGASSPPRLVHLSSMAVYGAAEGEVAESAAGVEPVGPYGRAKREAEADLVPLPGAVILRPGIVYGPGSTQWSERIARLLFARRLGDLGAAGDGRCNLVYRQDVVAAILAAIRRPAGAGGVYNLAMSDPPTWNDYLVGYGLALGAVPVRRIGPRELAMAARLLAPPAKIAQILLGRISPALADRVPPPLPPSLVRLFAQDLRLVVHAAERDLGSRWTPLAEGLAAAAQAYSR